MSDNTSNKTLYRVYLDNAEHETLLTCWSDNEDEAIRYVSDMYLCSAKHLKVEVLSPVEFQCNVKEETETEDSKKEPEGQ